MKLLYSRHSGARVTDDLWVKDMRLVVLENDALRVSVLPEKGSDIVEFLDKRTNTDVMWRTYIGLRSIKSEPNLWGHERYFNAFYEGGWQELFPHGSGPSKVGGVTLPMHGEVQSLPWKYAIVRDTAEAVQVRFWTQTVLSRFQVVKQMTINASDPVVHFSETVTNVGGGPFDILWGHHPAFGAPFLSGDCLITLPKGRLVEGDESMLRIQPEASASGGNMFYLTDFSEGHYGIKNGKLGVGFGMRWDPDLFKVIWIWQGYERGTYACAIEPFSGFSEKHYDIAGRRTVEPGRSISTEFDAFLYHGDLAQALRTSRESAKSLE